MKLRLKASEAKQAEQLDLIAHLRQELLAAAAATRSGGPRAAAQSNELKPMKVPMQELLAASAAARGGGPRAAARGDELRPMKVPMPSSSYDPVNVKLLGGEAPLAVPESICDDQDCASTSSTECCSLDQETCEMYGHCIDYGQFETCENMGWYAWW